VNVTRAYASWGEGGRGGGETKHCNIINLLIIFPKRKCDLADFHRLAMSMFDTLTLRLREGARGGCCVNCALFELLLS